MRSKEVIRKLEAAGWVYVRRKGSHVTFKKQGVDKIVTVPDPEPQVAIGTLKQIEEKSGVRIRPEPHFPL